MKGILEQMIEDWNKPKEPDPVLTSEEWREIWAECIRRKDAQRLEEIESKTGPYDLAAKRFVNVFNSMTQETQNKFWQLLKEDNDKRTNPDR